MPEIHARQDALDKLGEALLANRGLLPAPPAALLRPQPAAAEQAAASRELAQAILGAPGLSARILGLANSAFYRRSSIRVRTVTGAIILLGYDAIRNLALGMQVYETLNRLPRAGNFRPLWQHAAACAVCAHALAQRLRRAVPEEAFVAGLLHDLGKLLIDHFFPHAAAQLARQRGLSGAAQMAVELEILGCSHLDAGYLLAKQWCLPEELVEAIGNHEFPPLPPNGDSAALARLVYVANRVAHYLLPGGSPTDAPALAEINALCGDIAGLPTEEISSLLEHVRHGVIELVQILQIPLGDQQTLPPPVVTPGDAHASSGEKDRLNMLVQIHEIAGTAIDFVQFLSQTIAMLFESFALNFVFLLCPNREVNRLEARLGYGTDVTRIQERLVISLATDDEIAAVAYNENRALAVNAENLSRFSRLRETNSISLLATLHVAALPIAGDGKPPAVLLVSRPSNGQAFSPEDLRWLAAYCQILAGVLWRAKLRERTCRDAGDKARKAQP